MESPVKKPVVIYAESTPNPSAMKFVANRLLVPEGATVEYKTPAEAKTSPLALQLFMFSFVKQVFIAGNYITITKNDTVVWEDVIQHARDFIKLFLEEGNAVVNELPQKEVATDNTFVETKSVYTEHTAPVTEIETKIVEILEEYIRPAVEQDGGLITFKSFTNGIVTVQMKGSCSGCPSSTLTLKAGIEGLLKRMVPDVKEVVAEAV
ncbi:MAG: NifU family protein [Bacteroidetes bacterium]|nr:NifU family protein [Bacteroidota bacterium]